MSAPPLAFCPQCGSAVRPGAHTCPACAVSLRRHPAIGVAVILLDGGRVLLGRRRGSYAGQWCIPCGYVEADEDVRAAAWREFREETGLSARLGRVYAVHSNFHNPRQHTVGIWFLGEAVDGQPEPADDLDALAFVDPADPPDLCFPTDRLVLGQLAEDLTAGRQPRRL